MHRWWCPCTHTSRIQHWWATPACSYPVSVAQLGHKSCTISMHNNMAICCHRVQSNIITSRSIFSKILTTDLQKFPIRARYRELLWIKIGCFASVIAVLNAIWSYIGLFNKEPQLYLVQTVEIKGGGYWGNLLHSVNFSEFFSELWEHKSHCSLTPVKYEWDSKSLTGTSAKSKMLFMEKLTNGALVAPTPKLKAFPVVIHSVSKSHNTNRLIITQGIGSLSLGDVAVMKLVWDECHRTTLMISQQWFG